MIMRKTNQKKRMKIKKVNQFYCVFEVEVIQTFFPNHIPIRKFFNYLLTETKELLEKEPERVDESNDDPTICGEEEIELAELVGQPKIEIECFHCDEHFNSISNLDEHLYTKHQIDREKHAAYLKWQSNKIPKTEGKN